MYPRYLSHDFSAKYRGPLLGALFPGSAISTFPVLLPPVTVTGSAVPPPDAHWMHPREMEICCAKPLTCISSRFIPNGLLGTGRESNDGRQARHLPHIRRRHHLRSFSATSDDHHHHHEGDYSVRTVCRGHLYQAQGKGKQNADQS